MHSPLHIFDLPPELWSVILSHSSVHDVCALRLVSRKMQALANANYDGVLRAIPWKVKHLEYTFPRASFDIVGIDSVSHSSLGWLGTGRRPLAQCSQNPP